MNRRDFVAIGIFGAIASAVRVHGKAKAGDSFKDAPSKESRPQTIVIHIQPNDSHIVQAIEQNVDSNGKLRDLIIRTAKG